MSRYGVIYIAHNPAYGKDVYKIGKTERDVRLRLMELNAETTNINEYKAVTYFVVSDVDEAELACHRALSEFRIQRNREFFKGDLHEFISIVQKSLELYLAQSYIPSKKTTYRAFNSNSPKMAVAGTLSKSNVKCNKCGVITNLNFYGDEPSKFKCHRCGELFK